MATKIDMSLDDMIKRDTSGRAPGGRRPASGTVVRGGRQPSARGAAPSRNARPASRNARGSAAPYSRPSARGGAVDEHMANADVKDVAASQNPTLKVKSDSKPNTVAGAICNIVRESQNGDPPSVMATGPAAINQAMKAIAIARKYLLEEAEPIDLLVTPHFEQDVRSGAQMMFVLERTDPIECEPSEDDLTAKERTDAFKLAGAIAGRVRDGEQVALTTKGPVPVLVVIKAIGLASQYTQGDNLQMKFAVQFRDLQDPERGNQPSTYLHFAIQPVEL